jgi:hypothetical protein
MSLWDISSYTTHVIMDNVSKDTATVVDEFLIRDLVDVEKTLGFFINHEPAVIIVLRDLALF